MQILIVVPKSGVVASLKVFDEHGNEMEQVGVDLDISEGDVTTLEDSGEMYWKPSILSIKERL